MANNRLYIVDMSQQNPDGSYEAFHIGRSMGTWAINYWTCSPMETMEVFNEWLNGKDLASANGNENTQLVIMDENRLAEMGIAINALKGNGKIKEIRWGKRLNTKSPYYK